MAPRKIGVQQEEEGGKADEGDDETQGAGYRVAIEHDGAGEPEHQGGEKPEEDRGHYLSGFHLKTNPSRVPPIS